MVDSSDAMLIRSKGFLWLASRFDSAAVWQQAGQDIQFSYGGPWWVNVPEEEWPEEDAAEISNDWQVSYHHHQHHPKQTLEKNERTNDEHERTRTNTNEHEHELCSRTRIEHRSLASAHRGP